MAQNICRRNKLGDRSSSDVIVRLRTEDGRDDWIYSHSEVLIKHGKYFAERLSDAWPTCQFLDSRSCIEVFCTELDYDYHVSILRIFYTPEGGVKNFYHNVKNALGILKVASALGCSQIIYTCVQYLEAAPWDENEEEEILSTIPELGLEVLPVLNRIQPVDPKMVREIFLSAIHAATSCKRNSGNYITSSDEFRSLAQEQVEYMLVEDDDAPLMSLDEKIKQIARKRMSEVFLSFKSDLENMECTEDNQVDNVEIHAIESASCMAWLSHILPKMCLLNDFIDKWVAEAGIIHDLLKGSRLKTSSCILQIRMKVVDIISRVFEAVGYGHVILPASVRANLIRVWLPFLQETKVLIDQEYTNEKLPHNFDTEVFQSIETSLVPLLLALPSSVQAEILSCWLKSETKYPDLSEAFEVWCYRAKAAKRRLPIDFQFQRS